MRPLTRFALLAGMLGTLLPFANVEAQNAGVVRIHAKRGTTEFYTGQTYIGFYVTGDPQERITLGDGMSPGTIQVSPGKSYRIVQVVAGDLNFPDYGTRCTLISTSNQGGFIGPAAGDTSDVTVPVDFKYCTYYVDAGTASGAPDADSLASGTVHFHADNSWVFHTTSSGEPEFVFGGEIDFTCRLRSPDTDCSRGGDVDKALPYGMPVNVAYQPDSHTRVAGFSPFDGSSILGAPGQTINLTGTATKVLDFTKVYFIAAVATTVTEGSIALTANSVADTVASATFQVHNAGPDAGMFVIQATGTTVVRAGSGHVAKTEITTPSGTCVQSSGPCASVVLASGASANIGVKTTTARLGDGSSAAVGANTCATVSIQSSGSDSHAADNSAPCSSGSAPVVTVATGGSPPASQTVAMGSTNVPVIQFVINPTAATTLDGITLTSSGSGNDQVDITAVKLYIDANANGVVDGSETALASGTFPSNNGSVTLAVSPAYAFSSAKTFLVTYDFNTTLASRYGGAIVLAGLLPLFFVPRKRRRGAVGLLLVLGTFTITSIGLGACGGDSTGPNPPRGSATFTAQLTGLTAAGTQVSGVSVQGATVTIAK